ncbi:zinc finger, CCHC-type containing protein [Tanacetum coccineum]
MLFGKITISNTYGVLYDGWGLPDAPDGGTVALFHCDWHDQIRVTNHRELDLGNPSSSHLVPLSSSMEISTQLYATTLKEDALFLISRSYAEMDFAYFWKLESDTKCDLLLLKSDDGNVRMYYVLLKDAVDCAIEVRYNFNEDRKVHAEVYAIYGSDFFDKNEDPFVKNFYTASLYEGHSRDAIFDENRFSSIPRPKDIIPNSDESQRDDHSDDVPSEIPEPRKGKRVRKAKSYGSDFQLYLVEGSRDQVGSQYSYCYSIEEDPRTYNEAMQSRDAAFWKEAIDDEIGSIMENNTWVLSDLPPGCKPLGCKWIFKRKMKVDGTIDKFKARLVIQGFRQKEGIDYFDTYAPVARITTIRLLLALAAIHNLVIHQMDVKTAFLNGDLDEEVYMKQPEGFVMPGNEHKVCKLVKSLYGLKQAPKQWHQKFDEVVLSSGFHLNQSDKCVYSKFDSSGKGVIICLYVDDMLIFETDQNQVDQTKKFLSSKFSMKDIGEADVILGIKIKRENKGIVITQSHYIEKILKKFNREDCYSDASWINHVKDSSSTSGWVFLLGGGAISWASKKQTCITGSTIESEFVAMATAGK